ncbi:MAG: MFS transporter [Xanthobacteraceae bacterium]|nr:MFS transporter [Xanthobacteraceae bacterium]QYK45639.1 MAG: MFS transporter [Xanthobacteraceae bacterium]
MFAEKQVYYGWRIVAAIFLITTVTSGLAFYNLSVLLNAFVAQRGFPVSLTSAATAAFFVSGGISGVLVGRIIDRYDIRGVLVGAAIVGAACLFSVGYLQETWQLFLFHIVFGLSYGASNLVPVTTLVTRWFKAKRAIALSVASTGFSMGGIFISPFVALSIERGGLSATGPWMAALFFFGIVPITLLVIRSNPEDLGLNPDGQASIASNDASTDYSSVSYDEAKKTAFYLSLSISYLFILGAQVGAIAHLYRLANLRNGLETAALALAFLASSSIVGRMFGGWVVIKMSVRTFTLQLMAVQGVALFFLAFADQRLAILSCVVLFGVTIGNSLVMQPLLLAEKFGTREYGRIYSMSQFIATVGVAGGPVAVGISYDLAGNYFWPFILMALATALGFVIMVLGTRR